MKKILFCLSIVFIQLLTSIDILAVTHKVIDLTAAGTLATELTSEELASVTHLTITGNIDARDFKTMRDEMPLLDSIDLSMTDVLAYTGSEGTVSGDKEYLANYLPANAFQNKTTLLDVILPNSITYIRRWSFGNVGVVHLSIPDNVTAIDIMAIANCTALQSLHIGASLEQIGSTSLYNLTQLQEITVDASNLTYSVENNVLFSYNKEILYYYPSGLTEILYTIPGTVTTIYNNAFNYSILEEIIVPSSVTQIQSSALSNMSLKYINIPSGLTDISILSFRSCNSMLAFDVDEDNPVYCDVDGVLYNKDKTKIIRYPFGKEEDTIHIAESVKYIEAYCFYQFRRFSDLHIILNDSIETIGSEAFSSATIDKITLPYTIRSLAYRAFYSCYLDTLVCYNPVPPTLGYQVSTFYAYTYARVIVPKGSLDAYQSNANWGNFQNIEEMAGYTANFNIYDDSNPLENASINFNDSVYYTNAEGNLQISDLEPGTYNYTIAKDGYYSQTNSILLTSKDITENINLELISCSVHFNVNDSINPIEDASVNFNDSVYYTNADGDVLISDVLPGTYSYTVSAEGYHTATDTLLVKDIDVSDTISLIALSDDASLSAILINDENMNGFDPAQFTYTLELPYGTTDIPNVSAVTSYESAELSIDQASELPGSANIRVIAENGIDEQNYVINFTIATGINSIEYSNLKYYPNPVKDVFTIEMENTQIISIYVFDSTGKKIKTIQNKDTSQVSFDLGFLNQGIYFISIQSAESKFHTIKILKD